MGDCDYIDLIGTRIRLIGGFNWIAWDFNSGLISNRFDDDQVEVAVWISILEQISFKLLKIIFSHFILFYTV